MYFVSACWHSRKWWPPMQIEIQMQISWVGRSTYRSSMRKRGWHLRWKISSTNILLKEEDILDKTSVTGVLWIILWGHQVIGISSTTKRCIHHPSSKRGWHLGWKTSNDENLCDGSTSCGRRKFLKRDTTFILRLTYPPTQLLLMTILWFIKKPEDEEILTSLDAFSLPFAKLTDAQHWPFSSSLTISNQDLGTGQPTLAFKVLAIGQLSMHEMHTVVRAWTGSSKMIMNTTMVMMIEVEMIKMEDTFLMLNSVCCLGN